MIKAICFDLDGVYFTPAGKKGFERNLIELTKDAAKVKQLLYTSPEMREFVTGKITEVKFWNFVRSFLNLTLTDQELCDLWVKEYEIDTQVRNTVLQVKALGYKTCICSNNNPARIKALEDKFHFLGDFDASIFSYDVGFVKPSKEIFETLLNRLQVKPEELVYSDDNPDRLQGAKDLGINCFVYQNFEQFKEELKKLEVEIN